jgi:CDP-glucose 4,6-dehydratase
MVKTIKGKRALVTGGAGFVGSHLVETLLEKDVEVYVLDIVQPIKGYFSAKKLGSQCQFIYGNVNEFNSIFDVVSKYQIEYIFHLAAQPIVEVAHVNPSQTLRTNIMGTVNVIESARLAPHVQGVIMASSDKAYGKLETDEYLEDHPLRGDHPYDVSKSAADLIARMYYSTYGVPVVTTRFGNIYGEGDPNYTRLIPSIVHAIVKGEVLQLRSDGKHVRELLYVKDVVDGYIMMAEQIDKVKGGAYNFAADDIYSVLELLKLIEGVIGENINHKILNTAKNEIPFQKLSSSKVKRDVGWKAKYSLESTINQIIEYYRERA